MKVFTQKLLVNFTNIYKEMAYNTELNRKFWSRKTEIIFSYETFLIVFIYNFENKFYGVPKIYLKNWF